MGQPTLLLAIHEFPHHSILPVEKIRDTNWEEEIQYFKYNRDLEEGGNLVFQIQLTEEPSMADDGQIWLVGKIKSFLSLDPENEPAPNNDHSLAKKYIGKEFIMSPYYPTLFSSILFTEDEAGPPNYLFSEH